VRVGPGSAASRESAGGLPAALLAGLALAWAFDRVASVRGWQSPVQGLIFGVYMFGPSLPDIAGDAALPLNGMRLDEARGTP